MTTTSSTADCEITTTRTLDAPRELVWKAWTEPEQITQWWGPIGFTTTIHEMDVRPGGIWRFIMHGPDGRDYPNKIVYIEIVKPERLVYDHGDEGQRRFHVTVTFEEQGKKTRVTMHALFESAAERERVVKVYNAIEGAEQTLARLAEHLRGMQ